ncbi:hypothetical protein CVS40_4032 [Lucilia cuprina]|nr:hypothetical protein CVS40_4032 [Lucilia cuprina]
MLVIMDAIFITTKRFVDFNVYLKKCKLCLQIKRKGAARFFYIKNDSKVCCIFFNKICATFIVCTCCGAWKGCSSILDYMELFFGMYLLDEYY